MNIFNKIKWAIAALPGLDAHENPDTGEVYLWADLRVAGFYACYFPGSGLWPEFGRENITKQEFFHHYIPTNGDVVTIDALLHRTPGVISTIISMVETKVEEAWPGPVTVQITVTEGATRGQQRPLIRVDGRILENRSDDELDALYEVVESAFEDTLDYYPPGT